MMTESLGRWVRACACLTGIGCGVGVGSGVGGDEYPVVHCTATAAAAAGPFLKGSGSLTLIRKPLTRYIRAFACVKGGGGKVGLGLGWAATSQQCTAAPATRLVFKVLGAYL